MSKIDAVSDFPPPATGSWSFHNPVEINFGVGCWMPLGSRTNDKKTLLLTTPGMERRGTTSLIRAGCGHPDNWTVSAQISSHPQIADLDELASALRPEKFQAIVALGGGSVIDSAKAFSLLLSHENLSLGSLLQKKTATPAQNNLPVYAIPTTAGTGSEVTPFATFWDACSAKKYSLHSSVIFPLAAFVDPELSFDVPRDVTIATGLDALSQALDSIWNVRATAVSLTVAMEAARIALEFLPRLATREFNLEDRTAMSTASLLAGLAISQTSTSLAHSLSYPITAHFGLAHGLACAFTLPAILDYNAVDDDGRIARLTHSSGFSGVADLKSRLLQILKIAEIATRLRDHGIDGERISRVLPEMLLPERAGNNLRAVTASDVKKIFHAVAGYLPLTSLPPEHLPC